MNYCEGKTHKNGRESSFTLCILWFRMISEASKPFGIMLDVFLMVHTNFRRQVKITRKWQFSH